MPDRVPMSPRVFSYFDARIPMHSHEHIAIVGTAARSLGSVGSGIHQRKGCGAAIPVLLPGSHRSTFRHARASLRQLEV